MTFAVNILELTLKQMENRKALKFCFGIVAIILGVTLFKQFDFGTFKFEKPAMAIVYVVGFIIAVYVLLSKPKSQQQ
jgi:hypothetical protein